MINKEKWANNNFKNEFVEEYKRLLRECLSDIESEYFKGKPSMIEEEENGR